MPVSCKFDKLILEIPLYVYGPRFEIVRDFMPVLATCKFDEYQIKSEGDSVETL